MKEWWCLEWRGTSRHRKVVGRLEPNTRSPYPAVPAPLPESAKWSVWSILVSGHITIIIVSVINAVTIVSLVTMVSGHIIIISVVTLVDISQYHQKHWSVWS